MKNLNEFNQTEFQNYFVKTEIYQQLLKDYTYLSWDKNCSIYSKITPRQFLGDSTKNMFSLVPFYYLKPLLDVAPAKIYDLGCGWNIFKKYIPNIVGLGEESPSDSWYYGDIPGSVDQEFVDQHQNYFESVFSINSLHFIPLDQLQKRLDDFASMIRTGGRGYIALNLLRMIDQSSDEFLIKTFGSCRPNIQLCDKYVRDKLNNKSCNYLIVDIDFSKSLSDVMDGNIRIVFEKI